MSTKLSKNEMIKQILQRSDNTLKITALNKLKVSDIKSIFNGVKCDKVIFNGVKCDHTSCDTISRGAPKCQVIFNGVKCDEVKEQPMGVRQRIEKVIRNFEDISDSDDDDIKEEIKDEIKDEIKHEIKEEPKEEPKEENRQKFKTTDINFELIPEQPVKQLSVQSIRKHIRVRFSIYQKDLKLLAKDYNSSLISKEQLLSEFQEIRDDFMSDLESFLDTQKKLSVVQYNYINDLLDKSVSTIEKNLRD